jgi:hypothetical protein
MRTAGGVVVEGETVSVGDMVGVDMEDVATVRGREGKELAWVKRAKTMSE